MQLAQTLIEKHGEQLFLVLLLAFKLDVIYAYLMGPLLTEKIDEGLDRIISGLSAL